MDTDEKLKRAEEKLAEIRAAKKEMEQQRALKDAPIEKESLVNFADVAKAFKEKRAITLSGTGITDTVRELTKLMTAKKPILNYVKYFYGANAGTVVPVWGAATARPAPVSENGEITADTSSALSSTNLTLSAFATSLPVSDETLKLSGVALESELQEIFADAYADAIAYQIFNGSGSNGQFTAVSGVGNATMTAANAAISIVDIANLALAIGDKTDSGVIVMNPSVYSAITVDEDNTKQKAWAKDLFNNKVIENVPVILTSYAPSSTADNACLAIAADFKNYAVAMGGEMEITPKKTAGTLKTTFDVNMYLAGKPAVANNFYYLKMTPASDD